MFRSFAARWWLRWTVALSAEIIKCSERGNSSDGCTERVREGRRRLGGRWSEVLQLCAHTRGQVASGGGRT